MNTHKYVYEGVCMNTYKCENCGVEPVEHKGEWCADCNLPERSVIK